MFLCCWQLFLYGPLLILSACYIFVSLIVGGIFFYLMRLIFGRAQYSRDGYTHATTDYIIIFFSQLQESFDLLKCWEINLHGKNFYEHIPAIFSIVHCVVHLNTKCITLHCSHPWSTVQLCYNEQSTYSLKSSQTFWLKLIEHCSNPDFKYPGHNMIVLNDILKYHWLLLFSNQWIILYNHWFFFWSL